MTEQYYSIALDEKTLQHYGVKGMKWGVRRLRERFNQKRQRKLMLKKSNQRIAEWSQKYYNRENISNKDMKKIITRMRLENEFRDVVRAAQPHKKKGRLARVGNQLADRLVNEALNTGVNVVRTVALKKLGLKVKKKK